jgi:hypothetical protein
MAETLSGIETKADHPELFQVISSKMAETLSGIETNGWNCWKS